MVAQEIFTAAWLIAGVLLGWKSFGRPNSLATFVAAGCFLASISSFLKVPLVLQFVVFAVSTLSILVIEEA